MSGLHNLLICCGPTPVGGTPGCEGCRVACWCGGDVGLREPGDFEGIGCLSDITHNWRAS